MCIRDRVWGASSANVFAVGDGIFHHDGTGWAQSLAYTGHRVRDVWGTSAANVLAVGEWPNDILRFDGQSWQVVPAGQQEIGSSHLSGLWGSSDKQVLAVGEQGSIARDDGTNWRSMTSPTTVHLLDVWGTSATDVLAVGEEGTVLHHDGKGWHHAVDIRQPHSATWGCDDLKALWGTDTEVFLVGDAGVIQLTAVP